jgi:hypothetical protein
VPRPKSTITGKGIAGTIVLLVAIGLGWQTITAGNKGGSGSDSSGGQTKTEAKNLTGSFVNWVPVDDGHGYAYFSVTNNGSESATATCTITVKDDFGDFGFDSLVGELVGAGQTISGKIALSVGKSAALINHGEVNDC